MTSEQADLGGGLLDMLGALANLGDGDSGAAPRRSATTTEPEPRTASTPWRSRLSRAVDPEPEAAPPERPPAAEAAPSGEEEGGLDALHELLVQPGLTRLRGQVNRLDRTVDEVANRLEQETRQTNHKFEDLEDYLVNQVEPALQDTQTQLQHLSDRTDRLAQLAPEVAQLVNELVQAQLEVQLTAALTGLEARLGQQMTLLRDQVQQQLRQHFEAQSPAAESPTGERTLSIQVIGLRR